ncbi:MAG TPA: flagellar basal body P-ring formation chaperone FlgA [Burkholderiaceae bacterium]|nr:flagellar basal body P-ring formation chaperone FlgA [Burkholderiaceae bacterium]
MKLSKKTMLVCAWLLAAGVAHAVELGPRQDGGAIHKAVEQFLQVQSTGIPGEISISVGTVDPHLYLASCPGLETFLPSGNKAWGKTTVGVRCSAPSHWTVYIPATVHVIGNYVAAVAPLIQGQVVGAEDVATVRGDLTSLPSGVITDLSQAIGFTVARSLPTGMPLRLDSLRVQQAVQQGQIVRLVSSGEGFRVSAEGRALANAMEGQVVQAKTAGGQVVSGIAKMGGTLEVNY